MTIAPCRTDRDWNRSAALPVGASQSPCGLPPHYRVPPRATGTAQDLRRPSARTPARLPGVGQGRMFAEKEGYG